MIGVPIFDATFGLYIQFCLLLVKGCIWALCMLGRLVMPVVVAFLVLLTLLIAFVPYSNEEERIEGHRTAVTSALTSILAFAVLLFCKWFTM